MGKELDPGVRQAIGQTSWVRRLSSTISAMFVSHALRIKAFAVEFAVRIWLIDELKERKQIENLEKVADVSKKILAQLEKSGYSKEEVCTFVETLELTAEVTLKAMIARRAVLSGTPPILDSEWVPGIADHPPIRQLTSVERTSEGEALSSNPEAL